MQNNAREIIHIKPLELLETPKIRVASYARVSSDSDDQLHSIYAQMTYYKNLIKTQDNWELVEVYADEGVSGVSLLKRQEFNRMISDAVDGKIDRIITKSISRFGRSTTDNIQTLRTLQSAGVTVFFEQEGIDTARISGENMLTIYSLIAEQESKAISENCKKGARIRMASGEFVSGNPTYGYRLVNRMLDIYEPEAEVVRMIFREYLQGLSSRGIAKILMSNNVPRKDGKYVWHSRAIRRILKNERYIGDMLLQKKYHEDAIPYKQKDNKGELQQYYVSNSHEPIISRIAFEMVRIFMKEQTIERNNDYTENLLSKKIYCKNCNTLFRRKETNSTVYWTCRMHNEDKYNCDSQIIPEQQIYKAFIKMYNKLKQNQEYIISPLISGLEKIPEKSVQNSGELTEINKQITELSEQIHVVAGLMSKGILDSAIFIAQNNDLKAKISKLKNRKAILLKSVKKDALLSDVEELDDIITSGPTYISQMNEELFSDIVQKVESFDGKSIDFILIGGLRFTERL